MVYKDVILHLEDKFHLDGAVTGLGWVDNKDWLKHNLIELFNHDGLIGFDIPDKIEKYKDGLYVSIPDFEMATQGESIADAIMMARDVIGLMGIELQDNGKELPIPYSKKYETEEEDIVTLVDVDFAEYRKRVDNRAVKKNCTIPYWLSVEAEKVGINYSRILQEALINILGLTRKTY